MKKKYNYSSPGLTILIFILTFPAFFPTNYSGLDASYFWALNYFFAYLPQTFENLIYPYGPLGFIYRPFFINHNFLYAVIFISAIRISFIYFLIKTVDLFQTKHKIWYYLIICIILLFASTDLSILGLIIVCVILYRETLKTRYLIILILISAISFFMKSNLALSSFSIILFFSFFLASRKKFILPILYLVTLFTLGILITGSIMNFLNFVKSIFILISGYSAALSIYTNNNWVLLIASVITLIIIPFIINEKRIYFIYILLLFTSFAHWKHSIIRQDFHHYKLFLFYLVFLLSITLVSIKKINIKTIVLMLICILSYSLNLKNVIGYQNKLALEKNPKNFYNTILRYNQFKSESITEAENSLFKSSISNFGLDLVKNRTIDVFPWELSYVAKNKLNWKPRPTLQAGAYNKDIDKISSKYFTKAFGPDFLLFHLSADHNLTNLGSIDNRYILNDEPLSIYEIFKNYKFEHKEKDFLILSKSDTSLLNNPVDGVINTLSRNTWINVPEINNKIIRLKFYYDKKIFAVLKELLIKGDIFYIEYKLTNNEIYKYRFNPETAQSGLWVSPFINDINSNSGYKVKSIRFSCSNSFLYKPQFHFQWQFIEIIDNNILNNKIPVKELKQEYILKSKNTFESSDRYWNTNPKSVTSVNSYSGKYSNYLPAKSYSSTFITEINEIQTESDYVTVLVKCNSLLLRKSRPIVAISVEKDGTSKFWSSKELESKFKNTWCENQFRWRINISDVKDYTLKVYVWNPKGNKCFIDDFAVEIF